MLEITDNDVIKTTSEKRSHESESIVNNKKFKYVASDQRFTIIPSHDNGKDLKLTHANFNNKIVVEEIDKQPEVSAYIYLLLNKKFNTTTNVNYKCFF